MPGPLDTEPGFEHLATYEEELSLSRTRLTQVLEQIPDLTGEARRNALKKAEDELAQSDELVEQMRVEVQKIPTKARPDVNRRIRNYATDAARSKGVLKSLADDRSALFGDRYSDSPTGMDSGREQRQQLLSGTDSLQRTSDRLNGIMNTAYDTEQVGASTLRLLNEQGETLQNTHRNLLDSEGYLNQSVKTLRGMARRMATNRIITVAIITILVLLIIAVIASKFR